jgi:hypothetical protein
MDMNFFCFSKNDQIIKISLDDMDMNFILFLKKRPDNKNIARRWI